MKDDLGIGVGDELVSPAEEFFSEFDVVEDLAVEGDPERGVLVGHWLVATNEIDDAEASVRQTHAILGINPGIVGTPMRQHPDDPPQRFRSYRRSIKIEKACDTAHSVIPYPETGPPPAEILRPEP